MCGLIADGEEEDQGNDGSNADDAGLGHLVVMHHGRMRRDIIE